ncbi:uncharacterized protein PAC_14261 [Phialocephala subalpina]|uniref:Uncharacterized protein n=1 Tax=Phialocephala subalpina TaxID=576137 RepID=A0A1L7XH38_9HELO|nr:uncharacterized protein PAC_14261 [Phialocephala subalpina]
MELAAAAGSAATVVQLVDFAGRTIKSTTSFFASVVSASKELEILRLRVQHLEQLFENTRALACSYQNTPLALEPQNQRTLDFLGHALTKCSVDLQELNCVLQKPVAQTDWGIVRMKRRVKHVLDEATLRRLSARLQDNIGSLNSLLSGISMHNDSVIHGSIQQVAGFVQHLPQLSAQLSSLPIESRLDRIDKLLEKLSLADNQLSTISTASEDEANETKSRSQATEYASSGFNAIGRFEVAGVSSDELFPALELFAPAFRTGMQFLYRNRELQILKEAMSWVLSEFHELLADVHRAAAGSYTHVLTDEDGSQINFGEALVPRRFYRKTEIQHKPSQHKQSKTIALPLSNTSLPNFKQDMLYADCEGFVMTNSGQLLARFEGTHSSEQWPLGESESGFVRISFVPKPSLKLPGIGIAFFKQSGDLDGTCHSFLTTFNILSPDAPILQAIKDGDRGVSKVLQKLKSGEHWAGDRDDQGRSLLSYAIESGSRDMVALLFRMGAHPQDSHNFKQMQFVPMQHIRS